MIDARKEKLIPLNQVPDHVPSCRRGKRLSVSTVKRWVLDGLETLRFGGTPYTSMEALNRFGGEPDRSGKASMAPMAVKQSDAESKANMLATQLLKKLCPNSRN